jgi:hypothetical protein
MITKSVVAALVMLGVYHLALPHFPDKFNQILGQQRGIYLQAQRYVFDVPKGTNVVVGSSMSGALNDELLGARNFKLTVPGDSVFTALEIVRRTGKKPTAVVIETNQLWRDANQELLHDLFNPWQRELRRRSNMFREEGRPANFVGGIAAACVRRICLWTSKMFSLGNNAAVLSPALQDLHPELSAQLMGRGEGWDLAEPAALLNKQTKQLADYVDILSREGGICILFEMPVDSSLSNLSRPRLWRQAVKERFPKEKYHWLSFDANHRYQTTDGVHLVPAEANHLTAIMVDYVNKITKEAADTSAKHANR